VYVYDKSGLMKSVTLVDKYIVYDKPALKNSVTHKCIDDNLQ
jgi:hypothetical protein